MLQGLATPLVGSMAENAVLFSSFGMGKRFIGQIAPDFQHVRVFSVHALVVWSSRIESVHCVELSKQFVKLTHT